MMEVPQGDTYIFCFSTRAFATGIPTTLAGTPVLSVKEEGNDTIITTGVTVDVDTGSSPVTGLHEASVVATSGNGYEVGKYYTVYISTGTVGGVSVVGEVVGHFRCMPAEDASAGVKDVNVTHVGDTAQTANDNGADINAIKVKTDFLPSATAGTTDGLFIAGTNAATTVTTSFTTTFTGNLTGSVDSVTGDTKQTADHTAAIADVPTVAEFNARTLLAASYFDPASDTVANVTTVATTTNLTNLPTIPANWITTAGITDGAYTAAKFAASSLDGKGDWNTVVPDAAGVAPTAAEINAEVSDVMKTDTVTLPGQAAPPLAPTIEGMIAWLYKAFRNRKFQNATEWRLYADNETTVDSKATVSDDGTDAIKQEIVTGP